ncbi:MAG: hypothetical protein ACXVDW_12120, partial [Bacteroidia bacterium]
MKKLKLFVLAFLFIPFCKAQHDSVSNIGTIKVSKFSDTVYIKVLTDWKISRKSENGDLSFTSFSKIGQKTEIFSPQNNTLAIVIAPSPQQLTDSFGLTNYFQNNSFIKSIKLRKEESDVVNLHVTVNKFGRVRFYDPMPVGKLGNATVVYTDNLKKEYKVDVVHVKTKKAFIELAKTRWQPATIKKLKQHPT